MECISYLPDRGLPLTTQDHQGLELSHGEINFEPDWQDRPRVKDCLVGFKDSVHKVVVRDHDSSPFQMKIKSRLAAYQISSMMSSYSMG
jgi:hypothetical protein